MQIIEIYDKNSDLRCHGKNIFKTMDKFLSSFPSEYRRLYDKNLETLKFFKFDRLDEEISTGMYDTHDNVIFYTKNNSLGHELMHVASNDIDNKVSAIESEMGYEQGIIEGISEYLFMTAYGLMEPDSYDFEVFGATMLNNIPDIFKYYFIPSHKEFIKLFPNVKDIYNLIFSMDIYHEKCIDYLNYICMSNDDDDKNSLIDINLVRKSIKEVINNLISIELSFENNPRELKEYGTKFMDLIGSKNVDTIVGVFYPKYFEYAEKEIKRRILKR